MKKHYKCEHLNFYPHYYELVRCPTPYCLGEESHCKDCGAFITICNCGYLNNIDGWSNNRRMKIRRKKEEEIENWILKY